MNDPTPCKHVSAQLSAFVDGQLPPEEHTSIQQHLRRCRDCRSDFRETLNLGRRVRAVPTRLAPERAASHARDEAARRRRDSLAGLQDGQSGTSMQLTRPRAVAAAAALLIVGLWAGWSIAVLGEESEPAPSMQVPAPAPSQPIADQEDPGKLKPFRPHDEVVPEDTPLKIDAIPANRGR